MEAAGHGRTTAAVRRGDDVRPRPRRDDHVRRERRDGTLTDTWAFRRGTWAPLSPDTTPTWVENAVISFDPNSEQLIRFGGYNTAGQPTAETWAWDGTDWNKLRLEVKPPARGDADIAYDPQRGIPRAVRRVVAVGISQ